jgi:hypothetical protein
MCSASQLVAKLLHQGIQAKFRRMIQAKLCRNQVTPATICNYSFKLIDMLACEGATSSSDGAQRAVLKHWLIVENILPGVRVIPNILFEKTPWVDCDERRPVKRFQPKSNLSTRFQVMREL